SARGRSPRSRWPACTTCGTSGRSDRPSSAWRSTRAVHRAYTVRRRARCPFVGQMTRPLSVLVIGLGAALAGACGSSRQVAYTASPGYAPSRTASSYEAPSADALAGGTSAPTERPGLGTRWGEDVYAPITMKPFERAEREPWATAVIRYN